MKLRKYILKTGSIKTPGNPVSLPILKITKITYFKVNHFLYMLIDILNIIFTLLYQKLLNDKAQCLH